jgi:hypothetical protein
MQRRRKLSGLNRLAAALLAFVWLGAGCAAIVFGFASGQWLLVTGGFVAIVYGLLWIRVVVRSRLLSWNEFIIPWRSAASRSGPASQPTRRDGSQ